MERISCTRLTSREIEVLKLVVKGYNNNQIAQSLFISVHTVKAHLECIYRKLNVHNKVQAAIYVVINNIINLDI